MKNKICLSIILCALIIASGSCSKKTRPVLGDFPKDADPHFPLFPGGPLKFYAAFNGSSTDKLMNAVDSVRANFPTINPFASIIFGAVAVIFFWMDMIFPSLTAISA